MTFNSIEYFTFLPLIYILFYVVVDRYKWLALSLFSVYFYLTLKYPHLLLLLFIVTTCTYLAGKALATVTSCKKKKALFWCAILVNAGVLVSAKYLNFITTNVNILFNTISTSFHLPEINVLVSIGVSYYVFQAISYLVDVYLGEEEPERHFGYFALYMGFFPKLLQGPIERAGDLLPQLKAGYEFNYDNMRSGLFMFAWGLFKKVVVADRLSLFVNTVYNDVHSYEGLPLVLATYMYAIQIYMDFSGYTDMALGTARLFNINLTQNFNSPYLATSVADFWRRWHISFSRWILDYIFKPLQMQFRDMKNWGTALALLTTFLVSGIWHGASWGFVVWGLLHGIYLAASVFYKPVQKKIYGKPGLEKSRIRKVWQTVFTFNLVCFAWIFFRANSMSDAIYVASHLLSGIGRIKAFLFMHGSMELLVIIFSLLVVFLQLKGRQTAIGRNFYGQPAWLRWMVYCSLTVTILLLNVDNNNAFIYFQF